MPKETSKYKEEYNEQAYKLTLLGMKDTDLAKYFEVTEKTINNWKNAHPTFLQSIKKGKEESDFDVVKSLRHRAIGYEYEEVREESFSIGEGTGSKTIITKKHQPADVAAAMAWLYNRQPQYWKRNREEKTVQNDEPVEIIRDNKKKLPEDNK